MVIVKFYLCIIMFCYVKLRLIFVLDKILYVINGI